MAATTTHMRAAVVAAIGEAPQATEFPIPTRGHGEALVRVAASALQPVDLIVASGRFYDGVPNVPFVPGLEAVGTVVEGESIPAGTRVRVEIVHPGYGRHGGCAEYVVAPETPVGDGGRDQALIQILNVDLPDELLAALGSSGAAAWKLVERARAAGADFDGAHVLVLGATGAVGEVLVQLAKSSGAARVVAAGRNESRLHRLRERGADATVRLAGQELTELTAALSEAGAGRVDIVFDPLWGEPAAAALDAVRFDGLMINFGQSAAPRAPMSGVPLRARRVNLVGYSGARSLPAERIEATEAVFAEAAAGRLTLDYEVVPLDDIAFAWERQAGSPGCKLVIQP